MQSKSYEFDSGHGKVYAIQYYVVKLINYLRQVGFLQQQKTDRQDTAEI
jgi:hypothetical protein